MKTIIKDLVQKAEPIAGKSGLKRRIGSPQIVELDVTAPGTWRDIVSSVVHLRPSQLSYLRSIPRAERLRIIKAVLRHRPACLVLSGGEITEDLAKAAGSARVCVLKSRNLPGLARLLVQRLAPKTSMHGVLIEVFGMGTLIIGESAIGKSEAALDLVLRGHKLAADDLVILEKNDGEIIGHATEMGRNLLQIRGLGIIDIRALYGDSATIDSARVGLVVELEEWKRHRHYSLLGIREKRHRILGVNLPYLKLPVKPGRNMATLIEVAVRNQMLKNSGVYTAKRLDRMLKDRLSR